MSKLNVCTQILVMSARTTWKLYYNGNRLTASYFPWIPSIQILAL